jgi:multicomponent Na+:H+ antiporter subunit E
MSFFIAYPFLLLLWVVLSGQMDAFHLSLGAISCAIVAWLTTVFLKDREAQSSALSVSVYLRLPGYLLWLMKEIVLANFHVFYLALWPGGMRHVQPELVTFKVRLKGEWARYVLANSITLTPGTVTVRATGNELIVHSISRTTTEGLKGDMEQRIARLFGEQLDA